MTIALYAGSFDPFTRGHLAVVRAAQKVFSHVRVLVAVNPSKPGWLPLEERVILARAALARLPNVSVDVTRGLVVDYAREVGASVLVRGVRDADDALAETELAALNRGLAPDVTTLLVPADQELRAVSSTEVRRRLARGEDVSDVCPREVAERLGAQASNERGATP